MSSASAVPAPIETAARPAASGHNPWVVALTVTLATFMEILDTSIANVSLPHIAGGLSASLDESTWVLTSYLVANAIVLPMSAWISGLIGRKRFYMICVAMFTVSSLCCGLAPSLGMLIFFRVLQGAGGGGLQPSEQSILADTFAPEQFGMAFAIYGMAVVLAPAIGPTLGGYITDTYNWRWIFFINVPLGLISLLLTERVVEDPPYLKEHISAAGERSLDWGGLVLVALGFGTLQIVLDKGQEDDWLASNFIVILLVISVVSLTAFAVWELRHRHPVVDLRLLLHNSNFAVVNLMMFTVGITLYGATVLLPQYVQQLMGYSAMRAGMVLTPGGFAIMLLMPLVGMLTTRVQARWMVMFGFLVSAAAFFHMSTIEPGIDFQTAVLYRIFQSVGLAFLFVPINTASYIGIPQEKSRDVSSMINLARNIGGSVGISMVETILARRSQMHHSRLVEHLNVFNPNLRGLSHLGARAFHLPGAAGTAASRPLYAGIYGAVQAQAYAKAYIDVIWFMAIACLVMVPFALLMKRNDPHTAQIGAH